MNKQLTKYSERKLIALDSEFNTIFIDTKPQFKEEFRPNIELSINLAIICASNKESN